MRNAEFGADVAAFYAPVWLHVSLAAECRQRCERSLSERGRGGEAAAQRRVLLEAVLGAALFDALGLEEQPAPML